MWINFLLLAKMPLLCIKGLLTQKLLIFRSVFHSHVTAATPYIAHYSHKKVFADFVFIISYFCGISCSSI